MDLAKIYFYECNYAIEECDMRLMNKTAIITGGGSGIGEATAVLFSQEGASVVVADLNAETAEATASRIKEAGGIACAVRADVTQAADVAAMVRTAVETYGKLDVLFNNAGIGSRGDVVEISEANWDQTMDVNLKGAFLGCKYAIPEMIKSGGGAIINTASVWVYVGGALSCVYPVSKIGLIALGKHTAVKYAPHNIRVNCVCPGHIETPMIQGRTQDPAGRETLIRKYPIGRLGKPIEVAYAVLFLSSDEASFITGTELVIDGGYTAQ